jgi:hypothetical protein
MMVGHGTVNAISCLTEAGVLEPCTRKECAAFHVSYRTSGWMKKTCVHTSTEHVDTVEELSIEP